MAEEHETSNAPESTGSASTNGNFSAVELEIFKAIRDIRFGSVEIVIHDSRVVQIEKKEKTRIEK